MIQSAEEGVMTTHLKEKHTLVTRWAHWINFPVLGVMIWSGLLIYWANDVYRIGIGRWTLFHFFPHWVYDAFGLDHRLAYGMSIHFFFMWLFAINGVIYFVFTLLSGAWRELLPTWQSSREAVQVILYELGLKKTLPPQGKYNSAQKIAYAAIVLMGLGSLLTGIAIYRPTQLAWLTFVLGGYQTARLLHFLFMLGYVGFFLIHIGQVIRAGWNNFRSMVIGAELVIEQEAVQHE
jgi:thiosulfate reductase cytochrome b subunit